MLTAVKILLFISAGFLIGALIPHTANAAVPPEAIRTQDATKICGVRTDTLRDVSTRTRAQIYKRDGVPGGNHTGKCSGPGGCKVDHRVSLEVGGSNDPKNLTIQPYFGPCSAKHKDRLENILGGAICKGKISPADAQDILYNRWEEGYKQYVNPAGCAR